MGDRNSIVVHERSYYTGEELTPLYLYSHWHGQELDKVVSDALQKGRTNDPAYFTRILISEMVKDDINGSTGFGISQQEQDHDSYNHMIHIKWDRNNSNKIYIERDGKRFSKDDFIKLFPWRVKVAK